MCNVFTCTGVNTWTLNTSVTGRISYWYTQNSKGHLWCVACSNLNLKFCDSPSGHCSSIHISQEVPFWRSVPDHLSPSLMQPIMKCQLNYRVLTELKFPHALNYHNQKMGSCINQQFSTLPNHFFCMSFLGFSVFLLLYSCWEILSPCGQ